VKEAGLKEKQSCAPELPVRVGEKQAQLKDCRAAPTPVVRRLLPEHSLRNPDLNSIHIMICVHLRKSAAKGSVAV
jgi:hypothetical protein